MEVHRTLQEWELSRLACGISPDNYAQIAKEYLDIPQVRLDELRSEVPSDSVTYMTKCLIYWRDLQPQNEARQLLYRKMTEAAVDESLMERKAFQFLVTGLEEESKIHGGENKRHRYKRRLYQIASKARSHPYATLSFVTFLPIGLAIWSVLYINGLSPDFSPFSELNGHFPAYNPKDHLYLWMVSICSGPMFVLIFLVFRIFLWGFDKIYKTQISRQKRWNKYMLVFIVSILVATYIPLLALHIHAVVHMRSSLYSESFVASILKSLRVTDTFGEKVQISYECCGIYDSTNVTQTCCIRFKTGCRKIHQKGCVHDVTTFVNERVKCVTSDAQLLCIGISLILIILGSVILLCSCRIYPWNKKMAASAIESAAAKNKKSRITQKAAVENYAYDASDDELLILHQDEAGNEQLEDVDMIEVQVHEVEEQLEEVSEVINVNEAKKVDESKKVEEQPGEGSEGTEVKNVNARHE